MAATQYTMLNLNPDVLVDLGYVNVENLSLQYQETLPISCEEARENLKSDNPICVNDALVRLTYHDPDWQWVQDQCLQLLNSNDPVVKGLAVSCLGHLARIHKIIDTAKVVPILNSLLEDPNVGGRAEDALDDIEMFALLASKD
jgi:hypothetical protein